MKTRKQLLERQITHEDYYAQFVGSERPEVVANYVALWGFESPSAALYADVTRFWDHIPAPLGTAEKMRKAGDYPTQAGILCVNKEAYRQWLESNGVAYDVPEKLSDSDLLKISSTWVKNGVLMPVKRQN